jgi:biotin-[acetyl-CoA-carboxylase] ligase BirA-like protein
MNKYEHAIELAQRANEVVEQDGVIVFPEVDTTMRVIDEAIASGKPNGYTAIALTQNAGVGSRDPQTGEARSWWSGAGNLMFSRIVKITPQENVQEIQMMASLAVGEVVRQLVGIEKSVAWKYPNDVLVNGAKISGVLARPRADDTDPNKVNLGVGVNIAATPPDAVLREKSMIKHVTCLRDCGVMGVGFGDVLASFDTNFNTIVLQQRYRRCFNNVLDRMNLVQSNTNRMSVRTADGQVFQGYFEGFSTQRNIEGHLVDYIHIDAGGEVHAFPSRDLNIGTWVRPSPHTPLSTPHFDHG